MSTALDVLTRRLLEDAELCETEAARLDEKGDAHGAAWWQGRAFDFHRLIAEARRETEAARVVRHG